jgi:myo-inositol-1(or 4)-monophosphatase
MINLDEAESFLLEIESQAAKTLRRYYESGDFGSKGKGGVDFLTQADSEVDKFIRESLQKNFPQAHVLTEESAPKDYSSLLSNQNVFIVDPLDGTSNFSRKNPNFAISIGLVDCGVSKLAVINAPLLNRVIVARCDKPSASVNGKPVHVSDNQTLKSAVIGCDWSWDLEKRKVEVRWLEPLSQVVRQIKMNGSAVVDLSDLAEGKIDAYLHSGLKPWDVAAASLIVEKAGGKVTTTKGEKWNVFTPDMLASNGKLHNELLGFVK